MNTLDSLLAQVPPREDEKRFVDKSLQLAGLIQEAMQRQGLTQRALAERLGKKESEVSRWLSGLHNFTLKTLTRIEAILDEDLILHFRDKQPTEIELNPQPPRGMTVASGDRWVSAPFQTVTVNRTKGAADHLTPIPEFSLFAA